MKALVERLLNAHLRALKGWGGEDGLTELLRVHLREEHGRMDAAGLSPIQADFDGFGPERVPTVYGVHEYEHESHTDRTHYEIRSHTNRTVKRTVRLVLTPDAYALLNAAIEQYLDGLHDAARSVGTKEHESIQERWTTLRSTQLHIQEQMRDQG